MTQPHRALGIVMLAAEDRFVAADYLEDGPYPTE